MKKRSLILALVMTAGTMAALTGCGCKHENVNTGNCVTPDTCADCGATVAEAPGAHDYKDATCNEPKTCKSCGETSGAALGHSSSAASVYEAAECSRCGEITNNSQWDELIEYIEINGTANGEDSFTYTAIFSDDIMYSFKYFKSEGLLNMGLIYDESASSQRYILAFSCTEGSSTLDFSYLATTDSLYVSMNGKANSSGFTYDEAYCVFSSGYTVDLLDASQVSDLESLGLDVPPVGDFLSDGTIESAYYVIDTGLAEMGFSDLGIRDFLAS